MNYNQFDFLKENGWYFRDIPWCTDEYWEMLMEVIIESNVQLIISTRKVQEKLIRGQILINEQGMQNINKWLEKYESEQTKNN